MPKNEYSKVYLKLVALEFTPEVSDKVLKSIKDKDAQRKLRVDSAKKYYKDNYKDLCLDLSKCEWIVDDEDKVVVQTCILFKEPDYIIRVVHDDVLTLVYSKEAFKVLDQEIIKKVETGMIEF